MGAVTFQQLAAGGFAQVQHGLFEFAVDQQQCTRDVEQRGAVRVAGELVQAAGLRTDPQCIANDYIVELEHPAVGTLKEVGTPIYFSETPGRPRSTAPEFGQHTEEVLLEHGYNWNQIEELRSAGAI